MPKPFSFVARRVWLPAVVGALIAVSLAAELGSYARPDIGFLLDAAARVLDGAKLYVDVVEINPPLIVVLNFPAVLLARALGVSEILVYRLGVTAVLLASMLVATRQLGRILPADHRLRALLLALVAFALFPLSALDFGQREHLLLAIVIPYLLLSTARALAQPVSKAEALGIGVLAGIGFALKPHFLLLWIAVEVYLRWARPRPMRVPAPESAAIALVLAVYGVAVLLAVPEYLRLLDLVAAQYHRFLYDPFYRLLVTGPGAALSLLALLAFIALRDRARHPRLWHLLAIGVLACFLGAAAQQKGLRYHFYPSFALAVILLGLVAADARAPLRNGVQRIYRAIALSAAVTTILVIVTQNAANALGLGDRTQERRFAELVDLVRRHGAGGRLYVMSYHIGSMYPLVNYSGVPSASRFPQLWLVAAEYLDDLKADRPLRYHAPDAMSASERYLNRAVLEDLETYRPTVLLVLRQARDLPVNGYRRLNYLAYFSRNPRLARVLDGYQWIADVGDYAVYERVPDGQPRTGSPPSSAPGAHDVIRADREGVQLRLQDPTFVIALVTFGGVLALALRRERAGM